MFNIDADKEVKWLNKKIIDLEQSILQMKQTAEWIWYHSDGLNRDIVENRISDQLGFKIKTTSSDMNDK